MHHVITKDEYMIWYMDITRQVITPYPEQVPLLEDLQYEQHVYQIQKTVSDHNFLELIYVE
jgi:hypothetical protein